jgi:hypothetical protein
MTSLRKGLPVAVPVTVLPYCFFQAVRFALNTALTA